SQRRHPRRALQQRVSGDRRRELADWGGAAQERRARRDLDRRKRAGARRRWSSLYDPSPQTRRPLTGLAAVPSSSLTARALSFLHGGPAASLAIVRDVLGIVQA